MKTNSGEKARALGRSRSSYAFDEFRFTGAGRHGDIDVQEPLARAGAGFL